MAVPISTDPAVYYTNFATGNGDTAPLYTDYAPDMDDNFLALRESLNQAIQEISAVGGPNAVISVDLVTGQTETTGRIGDHSYQAIVDAGDNTFVNVTPGTAMGNGDVRVESTITVPVTSSGSAGTRWIYLDATGQPQAAILPAVGVLDLISVEWLDPDFDPGTEIRLAEILPDGDDFIDCRKRPATGQWTVRTSVTAAFRKIADRLQAIEAAITGIDLDDSESPGLATSKLGLRGTVAAPGLFLSDGISTFETDSGLYRAAVDQMGYAVGGVVQALFGSFGFRTVNGDATTPSVSSLSDTDAGIYWSQTPDLLGFSVAASAVLTLTTAVMNVIATQTQFPAGIVTAPSVALVDLDTGLYRPDEDELGITLGGVLTGHWLAGGLRIPNGAAATPALSGLNFTTSGLYWAAGPIVGLAQDAVAALFISGDQFIHTPGQPRVRATITGQTMTNAIALEDVVFDTEGYDVGGFHAGSSADFTIPTDAGGNYIVIATGEWESDPAGDRRMAILFNSVIKGQVLGPAASGSVHHATVMAEAPISAGQIIKLRSGQDSGTTNDANFAITIRKVI